jgi:hypothetical protein
MMEIRQPAYATAEIFCRYAEAVVFPAIADNRNWPGCRDELAILFCDDCAAHCSRDLLIEFARHGILVLTSPPDTSNLFQVLDPLLFGRLKSTIYSGMVAKSEIHLNFSEFGKSIIPWKIY